MKTVRQIAEVRMIENGNNKPFIIVELHKEEGDPIIIGKNGKEQSLSIIMSPLQYLTSMHNAQRALNIDKDLYKQDWKDIDVEIRGALKATFPFLRDKDVEGEFEYIAAGTPYELTEKSEPIVNPKHPLYNSVKIGQMIPRDTYKFGPAEGTFVSFPKSERELERELERAEERAEKRLADATAKLKARLTFTFASKEPKTEENGNPVPAMDKKVKGAEKSAFGN